MQRGQMKTDDLKPESACKEVSKKGKKKEKRDGF